MLSHTAAKLVSENKKTEIAVKHTVFQERLIERLFQLEFNMKAADRGYGKHIGENLSYLQTLKKENPTEHDQLIHSNEEYQKLFQMFPDWTDQNNLQKQYEARDIGFGLISLFALNSNITSGQKENIDEFNAKVKQTSDMIASGGKAGAFLRAINSGLEKGEKAFHSTLNTELNIDEKHEVKHPLSPENQILKDQAYKMLAENDLAGVRSAVQTNPWLLKSTYGLFGTTLLHEACWNDQTQMVELLLSLGADVNACESVKETPLRWGVYAKAGLETIKVLIRHGANLDDGGPLYWASVHRNNKKDVVVELLKAGARYRGDEVFYQAVIDGDETLVDLFIAKSFSVDTRDDEGNSLLTWAANNSSDERHYRIAEKLLSLKADVNTKDKWGTTPLHWAVSSKSKSPLIELATLYLDHGAKLSAANYRGVTPLLHAAEEGALPMVELLVPRASESDLLHTDKYGSNLLHYAAKNFDKDVCQYFINKGFDCNAVNSNGWTPLHDACYYHKYENILSLLKAGANPNMQNKDGNKPIDLLSNANNYEKSTAIYKECVEMLNKSPQNQLKKNHLSIWQEAPTKELVELKDVEVSHKNTMTKS